MSRIPLALASLFALASQPCLPTGSLDPKPDPVDTGAPEDTGDSHSMGPCESGICELTVIEARVECSDDPMVPPDSIEQLPSSPGEIVVWHHRHQQGCCPELSLWAVQDLRHNTIEVTYDLYDDMCDCICDLDIHYTLGDAWPGSFELRAGGASATVTVE